MALSNAEAMALMGPMHASEKADQAGASARTPQERQEAAKLHWDANTAVSSVIPVIKDPDEQRKLSALAKHHVDESRRLKAMSSMEISEMAFSNKCPVCGQSEEVNSSGRFVGHAGKRGGNCPGSGKTMPEARGMSADTSDADAMDSAPSRELDAVDFARETHCPYCTRRVAMQARTLGDHRTHGGVCDGSGRRVAEFDSMGRPVLEARARD